MTKANSKHLLLVVGLCTVFGWSCWPTLCDIAERWVNNPLYSHGYFVPLFAGYLLWARRNMIHGPLTSPSWWGFPFAILGVGLHLFGAFYFFDWISAAAILPMIAGLFVSLGGLKSLRWSWPAIAFLVFMLPLPYRLEVSLAYPLQRLATITSTYALQTFGFGAVAEGNVILMENARIGVVEACNGLGMLVTFFALATGLAMVIRSRISDKIIIVLSAIPVALLANTIRITVTGMLAETAGKEIADFIFHDLAGWLMMPIALGLLWTEKLILEKMWVVQQEGADQFGLAEVRSFKPTRAVGDLMASR